MRISRIIGGLLALLSVILYSTGYWICEYFYMDDMTQWRGLRDTLTGVVIAVLVLINFMPRTRLSEAALWAFGILCFGNLVDRLLFNINVFVYSDYALIGVAVLAFIYKLKIGRNVKTILE